MCDNNDGPNECCKRVEPKRERSLYCGKCKNESGRPAVYIRNDDPPLCWSCFTERTIHKLRSVFGKSNIIKDNGKVVLGFSCGMNSFVLLDLICKINSTNKKLRFNPHVISISFNEEEKIKLENALNSYGVDFTIIEIDDVDFLLSSDYMKRQFIHRVLANRVLEMNYEFLLMGDSSLRLSQLYLSGISYGKGAQLNHEVNFIDKRFSNPVVLRPLHDFLPTQIAYYFYQSIAKENRDRELIVGIPPVIPNSYESLASDFISGLQFAGFPSSILNILKISDKVELKNFTDKMITCKVCLIEYPEEEVDDIQALGRRALEFSNSLIGNNEASIIKETSKDGEICYACTKALSDFSPDQYQIAMKYFSTGKNMI